MSVGGLIRGILVGIVTYLTGLLFFLFLPSSGHMSFTIARPELVLFYVVVGGLAFSQLGIAIGFFAKSMEQVALFGSFILVPLTYLGGVFVSTQNLSPTWQAISHLNPILYYVEGLRAGFTGVENVNMMLSLVVSLAGLLLFHVLAIVALKRGSFSRW
jgi:ABC-2 type transport system permease protein